MLNSAAFCGSTACAFSTKLCSILRGTSAIGNDAACPQSRLICALTIRRETSAVGRSFLHQLTGLAASEAQRESERDPGADLVDRAAICQRVAQSDVDREIVAHLPDRADQARNCMGVAELFLVENLGDRAHLPFRRPLHDGT